MPLRPQYSAQAMVLASVLASGRLSLALGQAVFVSGCPGTRDATGYSQALS